MQPYLLYKVCLDNKTFNSKPPKVGWGRLGQHNWISPPRTMSYKRQCIQIGYGIPSKYPVLK